MTLTCVIALVLSAILAVHSLTGARLTGCGAGSSCGSVTGSRWSFFFGLVPVSVPAVSIYSALLAVLLLADRLEDSESRNLAWSFALVAAGAVSGAALWFMFVQIHFIAALCPYCMSAHVCGLILSVLLPAYAGKEGLLRSPSRRTVLFLSGLGLAALMAGVHYLTTPSSSYDRGKAEASLPDISAWGLPTVGDERAAHRMVLLYDYRCSHCRKLHSMLDEVVSLSGGDLAFTLCPVPLSKECNPYISTDVDLFKGSCTSDRAALAVWRARPSDFARMDSYLFGSDSPGMWRPRSEEDAVAMAESLIGREALERELASDWMRDMMAEAMELFGRTSSPGKGAIPRFICGNRYLVPEADDAASLVLLLNGLLEDEAD